MSKPIIKLTQLSFKANDNLILNDINLSIEEGEFVTITGPSGSGKSTLLKIMASMISQTAGSIDYQGKRLEEYDPIAYRKEVSYCFQTAVLFGKTVQENLSFPYEIRQETFNSEKAAAYLMKVGLNKTYLTKNINDLSGGEKQRIALVRNLLITPKVLLLDEVTSALDAENQFIVRHLIREMNQTEGITVLWVTHNADEIAESDRVIQIVNGEAEEKR
ncbi:ABC transporter ATP-binding protein [Carnobacterium antarcticum]|uniref:ATP-binding cassette domain-containing protein n=1 Tax=Carnobacterium antarcticum TaxID=2126436 RepID=A0ABW4NMH9_9LACT|nr:ATP-binding cassette domain-containing protein [Carnobacterium sp. CP1]ALV22096.1 YbbL ABC transporter ATP-binding protein [Carnobacterium sp. CP1]